VSRSTHSSGVLGGTSIRCDFPFIVIAILLINHTRKKFLLTISSLWEAKNKIGMNRRLHVMKRRVPLNQCAAMRSTVGFQVG
jgi:hypothetical protein